ncbi:Ig domain protein, group 1 domain protein [metagenome]|uniref:Ig domain protein, group 1 domain protein n=1 Tax=metagenome TaxID=256318 RepID=A0A2P2CES4_9ZZZZ
MSLGSRLVAVVLPVLLLVGAGFPASAVAPVATTLTVSATAGYADRTAQVAVGLRGSGGDPVAGAQVTVERRTAGEWAVVGTLVTDPAGEAVLSATRSRVAADNAFRASYAGDADHSASAAGPVTAALTRRTSVLALDVPDSVVDETSTTLRVRWSTRNGLPVEGEVRLYRRAAGHDWKRVSTLRTDADGEASIEVRPRVDTRWKAQVAALDWASAAKTASYALDNLPPNRPVSLPKAAPSPRVKVPAQRRAVGAGANAKVSRIPDGVWRRMTGISWHSGCPVGRSGLRYLSINYWDYSGYRRRGALVANKDAVGQMSGALTDLYASGLPLRSLYPIDRFGYSSRLRGGNDYRSMAAGNSSAFNCRSVVNKPGVRSPHSYGRSLDLNTWENPYRSATGLVPNSWWQAHRHPRVAWRTRAHAVVRILAAHGLRWTYGVGDTQHFDAAAPDGRILVVPDCVCD